MFSVGIDRLSFVWKAETGLVFVSVHRNPLGFRVFYIANVRMLQKIALDRAGKPKFT